MTSPIFTLGATRVLSARLWHPWRGAWHVDLDLDPDGPVTLPPGRQTLTLGTTTLSGTVDPRFSARWVSNLPARLVAGAGAWDATVPRQQYHSDAGVTSTRVYTATASAIGEQVNDPTPVRFGVDFTRKEGRASQVFGDRDWYVDLAGVTQVSPRTSTTQDPTTEILDYDPIEGRLFVASDVVVMPGTILTDPVYKRFDGTLTAKDVEQTFTRDGWRANVWTGGGAATQLFSDLTTLVRETSGVTWARAYLYRHLSTGSDDRVTLQAVDKRPGIPDLVAVTVWPGAAGAGQKLAPGQGVRIVFAAGDPAQPMVVGFDNTLPTEATLDARSKVRIGPNATAVEIAGGGAPVARVGDQIVIYLPPGIVIGATPSPIPIPVYGVIQTGSPKAVSG